jgi:beta-mannosidase
MQGMPDMSTLQRFTRPEDLDYPSSNDSYVMRLHERHPSGHILLPGYTFNYSCATGNTTRISYFSQVMQSYALEMAITTLRLNKPYNMGSLYWQLNDVWPVTSWATVDYFGTYKAAHYKVRSSYEQLIIHTIHDKVTGDYVTYIVNDYNKTFSCHCQLAIITFAG